MKKVCKVMASMALLSTLCMTNIHSIKAKEQTNIVKNDDTGIPDSILYTEVLRVGDEQYGNKDGVLTTEEMQAIEYLHFNIPANASAISLKGIDKLSKLISFEMHGSNTKQMVVNDVNELKKVTNIESINISGAKNINTLEEIIGENSTVQEIYIYSSNLQSIAGIERAKNLKTLNIWIENNQNAPLELDANQLLGCKDTLIDLDISGWKVKNVEKLGDLQKLIRLTVNNTNFPNYNFIKKLNLESLGINYNGISDISFLQNQTKLHTLFMSNNNITDISVMEGLSSLININVEKNAITDITPLKNSTASWVYLGNNKISDIRVLEGKKISNLSLENNQISNIDALKDMPLEGLNIGNNNIKDISVLAGKKLVSLDLSNNQISDLSPLVDCVTLERLDVHNNLLTTLPDLTKLVNLGSFSSFSGNELTADELKAKMPKQLANNVEWIQNNKMYVEDEPIITVPAVEEIISATIPADLADKLNAQGSNIVKVTLPRPDTVVSEVFKAAKENGKSIQFDVTDKNGDTQYGWKFNGTDIKDPNMNIDLTIKFETEKQKEIEKLTNQSNMMYVSFVHHGPLPGPATIKVKVDEKYKNGDIVYLYYFNEEKGTIEQNGEGFSIKDGYAEFMIDHCSVYYLSTEKLEEATPVQPTPVIAPNKPEVTSTPKEEIKEETKENKKDKTPNTGDHTNTMVYLVAGAGALAALAALTVRKIKQN